VKTTCEPLVYRLLQRTAKHNQHTSGSVPAGKELGDELPPLISGRAGALFEHVNKRASDCTLGAFVFECMFLLGGSRSCWRSRRAKETSQVTSAPCPSSVRAHHVLANLLLSPFAHPPQQHGPRCPPSPCRPSAPPHSPARAPSSSGPHSTGISAALGRFHATLLPCVTWRCHDAHQGVFNRRSFDVCHRPAQQQGKASIV
jgi:hypothetical protein